MPTTIEIPVQGDPGLQALAEGDETNLMVSGTVEGNDGNIVTLYVNSASVSEEAPEEEEMEEEPIPEEEAPPTITRTKAVVAKPPGPPGGLAGMMRRGA